MDWKMPGVDGIEASSRIKNHPTLSKVPAIILVTAYGREEIMQKAEDSGLDGFLIKPVNASVLFDTVMQAVQILGTRAEEKPTVPSTATLPALPPELIKELVNGIQEAGEMGDFKQFSLPSSDPGYHNFF